jgi:hypothetical protein
MKLMDPGPDTGRAPGEEKPLERLLQPLADGPGWEFFSTVQDLCAEAWRQGGKTPEDVGVWLKEQFSHYDDVGEAETARQALTGWAVRVPYAAALGMMGYFWQYEWSSLASRYRMLFSAARGKLVKCRTLEQCRSVITKQWGVSRYMGGPDGPHELGFFWVYQDIWDQLTPPSERTREQPR